ncbi:MAG: site-specific recombinase [Proteobacteria bacterium]|nr:site-specific recombinase [Pseudomonadota bacterium]
MKNFLSLWKNAGRARMELDVLLSSASPDISLRDRVVWLVELIQWARSPGRISMQNSEKTKSSQLKAARVRYFLLSLERNPEWKLKVAHTLRSIISESSALDLFCTSGLPEEPGFMSEATERFLLRTLPRPPHDTDLGEIFIMLFPSQEDANWLSLLDDSTLEDLGALLKYGLASHDVNFFKRDLEDAFLFLAGQVRALGLDPRIRRRTKIARIRERPFFKVSGDANFFVQTLESGEAAKISEAANNFRKTLLECLNQLTEVHLYLEEFGVSVAIVYQLDRISSMLKRLETMLELLEGKDHSVRKVFDFFRSLIIEAAQRKSLGALFSENLSLLSQKIAERSAETGDHYITHSRKEYLNMFEKALGGGFVTAFTAFFKVVLEHLSLAYFIKGFIVSLNYAGSFVLIHFLGFTLATKQPAMTANALAAKMSMLKERKNLEALVDEIICLFRSQIGAVLGNITMVIPVCIGLNFIFYSLKGSSFVSSSLGTELLATHSLKLPPLLFYGAFTGILLWLSSVAAGWIDNWSAFREIDKAIAHNRRLRWLLGSLRAEKLAQRYRSNLAGISGSIILGFLLGLSPKFLAFLGIPLDVRHVTLSTGVVTLAACSQGIDVVKSPELWWAVLGIVGIGLMNISVSFGMAFWVALRARKIEATEREEIYALLLTRIRQSFGTLFFPPKS